MQVLNRQSLSDICQRSVGSIEEAVRTSVVLWSDPFALQHSPKRFRNIQMWGIWRQEEEIESPLFQDRPKLLNPSIAMHSSVVEHNDGLLTYTEGEVVNERYYLVSCHSLCGCETLIFVAPCNHTEDIEPCNSLGWNVNILFIKLPAVWNISFCTGMTLISIIKLYETFLGLAFKFLQLLDLIFVELRRGDSPWAFSYTLISCTNADKKRLKVDSLASLPVACSQAALALLTLCRSSSMARRTASSSEQSMMGLRPRPGRVSKPFMPSVSNRCTHDNTVWASISVCSPTLAADRPSLLRSTARQRIRKQCFSPCRKPYSNSRRSASVRESCLMVLIISTPIYYRTENRELYYV